MSSDGYFDDLSDFDDSALAQIDQIEAAHFSPSKQSKQSTSEPTKPPAQLVADDSFDSGDLFQFDEAELAKLDDFVEQAYRGETEPTAGPSKFSRIPSGNMLQTTLTGEVIMPSTSASAKPRSQIQRAPSNSKSIFGNPARKTKKWDQTAFAKSGAKHSKNRDKGKGKSNADQGDEEEEAVEFEQFPAPFVSGIYLNF